MDVVEAQCPVVGAAGVQCGLSEGHGGGHNVEGPYAHPPSTTGEIPAFMWAGRADRSPSDNHRDLMRSLAAFLYERGASEDVERLVAHLVNDVVELRNGRMW